MNVRGSLGTKVLGVNAIHLSLRSSLEVGRDGESLVIKKKKSEIILINISVSNYKRQVQ